jgi:lysophospholipase L1-like esterase
MSINPKLGTNSISFVPGYLDSFLSENSMFYRYLAFVLESMKYRGKRSRFNNNFAQLIYLDKMYEETKMENTRFMTTVLGDLETMSSCNPNDYMREIIDTFVSHTREKGIFYFNILDVLCNEPIERLDRGDHGHFTPYAYDKIARRIYEVLKNRVIIQ